MRRTCHRSVDSAEYRNYDLQFSIDSSNTEKIAPFISCLLFVFLLSSPAHQSFWSKALALPVAKDGWTSQYLTCIHQRPPPVPLSLVVDLGGWHSWVACDIPEYISSTFRPSRCGSAQGARGTQGYCRHSCLGSPAVPGCNNNTCILIGENTVRRIDFPGGLGSDGLSLPSTDGSNPGNIVRVPQFLFVCGSDISLFRLASGATGMAPLGRTKIALPLMLSSAFSFSRKFAICLPSSNTSTGVIFFGDGPYNLLPNVDASQSLTYTPLLSNPVHTYTAAFGGEPSYEYFIGVKSITVGNKLLSLNSNLLTIKSNGHGGTELSTVNRYTVLETSIFAAFTKAFISEAAARNITRVGAVRPFEVCFSSKNIPGTRVGPAVPYIYLTLQNKDTIWTITGSNSMVQINNDFLCLGAVDGGSYVQTAVLIEGYQLENNLIQFDLARSRVGFSNTLLGRQTTCGNFNFTSTA
ncbi:probable aspartic proteinase GIP2 [Punica granatum]|uniref:Probable aspartic proteinase GIP2 n=1 Tax=Punica granatum TaxID=22663 RepID=A0A6P8BV29_PUNGR|nr:probable aspartic proteinase GIP2 [Punica granatum]